MTNNTLSRLGILLLALLIAVGFARGQVLPGPGFLTKPKSAFTPLSLSPALWLDAADAATVTLVSSAVSQWNDKSGNNRHAAQATSGSRPTNPAAVLNSLPVVRFNGSSHWLQIPSTAIGGTDVTIFLVIANAGATQTQFAEIIDYNHNLSTNWVIQQNSTNNNSSYFAWYNGSGFSVTNTFSTSGTLMGVFQKSGATGLVSLNGTTATQTLSSGYSTTARRITIGSDTDFPARTWAGDIGEILVYASALNTTQRQQIEGYLAWKWGTVATLPSGHPYKTFAP